MPLNAFNSSSTFISNAVASPLAVAAIDALRLAATLQPAAGIVVEERSFWQPDSWLIQRCWEALAEAGFAQEAMAAANLAHERYPLAPIQTVQRLAKLADLQFDLKERMITDLRSLLSKNNAQENPNKSHKTNPLASAEGLLAAASAALRLGEKGISLAFMERLDQLPKGWEHLTATPEQRQTLAEIVANQAQHPLINTLISSSLRRFGDAGALFLNDIAQRVEPNTYVDVSKSILGRCVDAFRFGTLATPQSQRLAIATYGRAGLVQEALQQADTLTNILEARRQSALDRQSDKNLVRQVKRPAANADADFQVHALAEAIHNLDIFQLSREQRVALANRVAATARRGDGWTAASAAQILVELGALKFATEALERIAANDPIRVEAVISLVRALLEVQEFELAAEQVEKALTWTSNSVQGSLHKQALIRGLGEVYLAKNRPEMTWQLLDRGQPPPTLIRRARSWFGEHWNDDTLRNEALRLRALLHPAGMALASDPQAATLLVSKLQNWSQQLLEGEALVGFTLDSLLRPLLEAGLVSQVWKLLPDLATALSTLSGDKHANRVKTVCTLLAEQALPIAFSADTVGVETRLDGFLQSLWAADAQRNLWQTVHGIEGSLPLLIVLDGAQSVLAIAQIATATIGRPEEVVIDGGSE